MDRNCLKKSTWDTQFCFGFEYVWFFPYKDDEDVLYEAFSEALLISPYTIWRRI